MKRLNCKLYCDACAEILANECSVTGFKDDTDRHDQPIHCAECYEFCENDLTPEGLEYAQDVIREDWVNGGYSVAINVWAPFYGINVENMRHEPRPCDSEIPIRGTY